MTPPDIQLWVLLLSAMFSHNILLRYYLGLCSYVAVSRTLRTSLGLGAAVVFVMGATTVINWAIYHGILVVGAPLLAADLTHLRLIVFILVIAAFVQLVEMIIERTSPRLHYHLGIFLPLITVNCAILGVSLFMIDRQYSLLQALAFGLGSGLGWTLVICLLGGIRQRLEYADVPRPLKGLGVSMILTGLMALAFQGFASLGQVQ